MSHTVQTGQSIFDVTVQRFGTINNLFNLARQNGLIVDDDLTVGTSLTIEAGVTGYKDIVEELEELQMALNNDAADFCSGIGCMIVGTNFIVQ